MPQSYSDITIRPATRSDLPALCEVNRRAFAGPIEARIVELLHERNKATVSLAAIAEGEIVGHVLFSKVELEPPQLNVSLVGLAPVAVLPEFQRRDIGSRLIREGLRLCGDAGFSAVVVLGEPAYYSRFGFERAIDRGITNEYHANEHFMVLELQAGALQNLRCLTKYQPEFAEAGC
jgi:putative acetyltransferase